MKILMASHIGGVDVGAPKHFVDNEDLNQTYSQSRTYLMEKIEGLILASQIEAAEKDNPCPFCDQDVSQETWARILEPKKEKAS